MIDREVQGAWRLYVHNWGPLLLMAMLLLAGLALTDFSFKIESLLLRGLGIAALLVVCGHALWRRGYPRPAFVLVAIAQLEILYLLATPLAYLAASADLPLQDANFAHLDRMLGLDWQGYYNFVCARPTLIPYLYLAYAMIGLPTFGVPIVLGLTRNYVRLQQFALACTMTAAVTVLVSALLPAIGTFHQFGLPGDTSVFKAVGYLVQVDKIPAVRDGSLRVLSFETLTGIVTFPSFHAAGAVLAVWGFWGAWWMRPFALLAYGGMLLATPLVGGHYFVDVFAGGGLAVLAIAAARCMGEKSPAGTAVMTQNAVTA
jgi:PAP2 superfamily